MTIKKFRLTTIAVGMLLTYILLFLTGCSTLEKKIQKARLIAFSNPKEFADFCATVYPTRDSVAPGKTVYVPADNKDQTKYIDSLNSDLSAFKKSIEADTSQSAVKYRSKINELQARFQQLKDSYRKCKPDTLYVNTDHYISNTAAEQDLKNKMDKLASEKEKVSQKLNSAQITRNWFIGISLALLLLMTAFVYIRIKRS